MNRKLWSVPALRTQMAAKAGRRVQEIMASTILRALLAIVLLTGLFLAKPAFAARTINAVTLDGAASVVVTSGQSISATVSVTTDGAGANARWRCTGWSTTGATSGSADYANFDSAGNHQVSFNITAPAATGTYNASFIAYSNNGCSDGASSTYTLTSAITVVRNCTSNVASGNWNTAGTWTNCGGGVPQAGDMVTILNGHTVTLNTNPPSLYLLTNGGTLTDNGSSRTLIMAGDIANNGTLNLSNSTVRIAGGATWSGNGTWNLGTIDFNWQNQALTLASAASFTLNLYGATPIDNLNAGQGSFNAGGANTTVTVNFARSGNQTIRSNGIVYPNLTLSGSGTKNPDAWATLDIRGNLTIGGGLTYSHGSAVDLYGNLQNNGTFSAGWGAFTLRGSSAQTVGGSPTFLNLIVNNSSGIVLSSDISIGNSGILTLTNGPILTGANRVIVSGNCSSNFTLNRTAGLVAGNVRFTFPSYAVTCVYPVGSGSSYTPISVTMNSSGGTLTGYATSGEHPQIATSQINSSRNANRHWTLGTAGDTLTSATSYSATFTFVSGDLDAGIANGNNFKVQRYQGGAWQGSASGSGASLSATITGQTAFGSFAVGEIGGCTESLVGGETLVTCISSGTFTPPAGVTNIRYLVVGGGGGGGGIENGGNAGGGGGGGAGGVLRGNSLAVVPGTPYSVTVGAGGTAGVGGSSQGGTGGSSSIGALVTASGGGGGASRSVNDNGANGASGGGGRINGTGGSGIAGQGFSGGNGNSSGGSGGGGGATAVGANGSGTSGGAGGAGVGDNITGASVTYGQGGNGGVYVSSGGRVNGANASANTGNGGGGATGNNGGTAVTGGTGGSGIVIIRYTLAQNCFTDNFTGSNGDSPGSNWSLTSSSGSFGLPHIMNNRLRLTNASNDVATAAHLLKWFPGAGNKIIVEFDYFAYNGTGADGIALTFSDASITPQAGAYGGSLGYAQRCGANGFAGGWLGIGIDEYGNFRNDEECRGDGGTPTGLVPDSVSVRGSGSGTTGYLIHRESGTLSPGIDQPGTTAGPGHRYRMTIDHSNDNNAWVTVERNTGSGYATIVPAYDAKASALNQAAVPANWLLSFTGSTGGSTNIHEIDNLSVCTINPIIDVSGPHHIRIEYSGSGLTCLREAVVFKACASADCSSLYTGGDVALNLLPAGQWYATATGGAVLVNPQTIPASGTLTLYLQQPAPATVSVNTAVASGLTPSGSPAVTCNDDTTAVPCSIVFTDAGLIFTASNASGSNEASIGNQIAGASFTTSYYLRAVKSDKTTGACVAAVTESRAVTLSYSCVDPATCAGNYMTLGGGGTFGSSGTSTNLSFDTNGYSTTALSFNYFDVGKIKLAATTTSDTGASLTGNSNEFVVKPYGFTVIACPATTSDAAAGSPTCTVANSSPVDGTGSAFAKAGEAFKATIKAIAADGAVTPSFGLGTGNGTESVALTHALIAPVGVCPGPTDCTSSLGGTQSILRNAFTNGVANVTNLTWSEVGVITLTATNDTFQTVTVDPPATGTSGNIGRFTPHHFAISESTPPLTTNSCTTGTIPFTYFGQDGFTSTFTLIAQNASNGTTQNYAGDGSTTSWAKLPLTTWGAAPASTASPGFGFAVSVWTPSQPGGASLAGSTTVPTATNTDTWTLGTTTVTAKHKVSRPTNPAAPTTITLTTLPVDRDGITLSAAATLGTALQRFGVLRLDNAYGSELLPIRVPVRAMYCHTVTGTSCTEWRTNADDTSCSQVSASMGSPLAYGVSGTPLSNANFRITGTDPVTGTGTTGSWMASSSSTLANGIGTIVLNRPLNNATGSADLTLTGIPDWLRGGTGTPWPTFPASRIKFGSPKAPYIYLRERY